MSDVPLSATLQPRDIGIFVTCRERKVKPFWISLQPKGDISIGCTDHRYQVVRRSAPGAPVVSDQIVRNPHVTFHAPHRMHLIGNRGTALIEALTWGSAAPPGEPSRRWIEVSTSPIRDLSTHTTDARHGKNAEMWPIECDDETRSPTLFVDFATAAHHALGKNDKTAKFLVWGQTVLLFRLGLADPQPPNLQLFTWG